jgi:hypothetical protein
VAGAEVVGQLGVGGESGSVQRGSGGVTLLALADLDEAEPFAVVGRLNLAREDSRKFRLQSEESLALLQLLRNEGPQRMVSGQQVQGLLVAGFGLGEAALPQQRISNARMPLSSCGVDFNGLAECGDGIV